MPSIPRPEIERNVAVVGVLYAGEDCNEVDLERVIDYYGPKKNLRVDYAKVTMDLRRMGLLNGHYGFNDESLRICGFVRGA